MKTINSLASGVGLLLAFAFVISVLFVTPRNITSPARPAMVSTGLVTAQSPVSPTVDD